MECFDSYSLSLDKLLDLKVGFPKGITTSFEVIHTVDVENNKLYDLCNSKWNNYKVSYYPIILLMNKLNNPYTERLDSSLWFSRCIFPFVFTCYNFILKEKIMGLYFTIYLFYTFHPITWRALISWSLKVCSNFLLLNKASSSLLEFQGNFIGYFFSSGKKWSLLTREERKRRHRTKVVFVILTWENHWTFALQPFTWLLLNTQ